MNVCTLTQCVFAHVVLGPVVEFHEAFDDLGR